MSKNESTETKQNSKNDIIKDIKENYEQFEKSLVKQLSMRNSLHSTTTGSAREDVWKQLFSKLMRRNIKYAAHHYCHSTSSSINF